MQPQEIITFWFTTIKPKSWWVKDEAFDLLLNQKFGDVHQQATQGELFHWRKTALGRLAEIIILDQFSRNIYRGSAKSFAYDALALILAQEAISIGANNELQGKELAFLYMPFMHSESLAIHQIAEQLFSEPGLEGNTEFEKRHKAIIEKFGRYPHRNKILNRDSSEEEISFLKEPGSSF